MFPRDLPAMLAMLATKRNTNVIQPQRARNRRVIGTKRDRDSV